MGELVDFRPRSNAFRCVGASVASAEILFFTGVRITRIEDAEEAPKGGRQRPGPRSDSPRSDPPRKRRHRKS